MSRHITETALVLHTRQSGESNREAFFLCEHYGIIRATVYGGPKSKLRAFVSPFHSGILYLYHDPVRDSYKVSDFDVRQWRPGLREVYERAAGATAVAETVLAGHGGGGDWRQALNITNTALDALEKSSSQTAENALVIFLWDWAEILGVRPESSDILRYPGAINWLKGGEGSLQQAKRLCIDVLGAAFGRSLSSWKW